MQEGLGWCEKAEALSGGGVIGPDHVLDVLLAALDPRPGATAG